MEKYNMGSFTSSDAILDDGLETGRAWYPVFKTGRQPECPAGSRRNAYRFDP